MMGNSWNKTWEAKSKEHEAKWWDGLSTAFQGSLPGAQVWLLVAACVEGEHGTKKDRHRGAPNDGDSNKAFNKACRARENTYKPKSEARKLERCVLAALSDMPAPHKSEIRLRFLEHTREQLKALKSTLPVWRTTDEDRYFMAQSELLHVVEAKDWDVCWACLWCNNDRQVVLYTSTTM